MISVPRPLNFLLVYVVLLVIDLRGRVPPMFVGLGQRQGWVIDACGKSRQVAQSRCRAPTSIKYWGK